MSIREFSRRWKQEAFFSDDYPLSGSSSLNSVTAEQNFPSMSTVYLTFFSASSYKDCMTYKKNQSSISTFLLVLGRVKKNDHSKKPILSISTSCLIFFPHPRMNICMAYERQNQPSNLAFILSCVSTQTNFSARKVDEE